MEFQLPIHIDPPTPLITYQDPILLIGSCFTEHIGNSLHELKFRTLQNPHGILFDPASVTASLLSYIHDRRYGVEDLVLLNEIWQSWQHHSRFSHVNRSVCLEQINASQGRAHAWLRQAKWLIITLGSAFSYRLAASGQPVANCHRAPAQTFARHLMTIEEIISALDGVLIELARFNPELRVVFTVSPVRHIRDGVIDNNRSKARLIEAVHHFTSSAPPAPASARRPPVFYFPAYELVIDVLRDYRFYDIDLVHPNYPATAFVLEKFTQHYIDDPAQLLMEEVRRIVTAKKHRAFQPATQAHKRFLREHLAKARELAAKCPFLDLVEEIAFFSADEGSD